MNKSTKALLTHIRNLQKALKLIEKNTYEPWTKQVCQSIIRLDTGLYAHLKGKSR